MKTQKKQNNFNLAIAFAILWVSFASIIQFHVERIHEKTHIVSSEFVKTENKVSFKKDSGTSFKIDLNSGFLSQELNEFHINNYTFLVFKNFSPKTIQAHLEIPKLRGPPLA